MQRDLYVPRSSLEEEMLVYRNREPTTTTSITTASFQKQRVAALAEVLCSLRCIRIS